MSKRVEDVANQKIISTTKPSTNYSFIVQAGKLFGILEEGSDGNHMYYFNPEGDQQGVNNDIVEKALRVLVRTNADDFDILSSCFLRTNEGEEYFAIAIKVFKEYWNKLYNLVIADDVFERGHFFNNIDATYDFFEKSES